MEKSSFTNGAKPQQGTQIPQKQARPAQKASLDSRPSQEAIAELAYAKFCERGRQEGFASQDWLDAERELTATAGAANRS